MSVNENESDKVLKFIFGLVSGVVLTILYVRFGFELPGVIGLEQKLISKAVVETAEFDLFNPQADQETRQRALAVVLANNPDEFVKIDAAIGNRFMTEYLKRHATNPYQITINSPQVLEAPAPTLEDLIEDAQSKPIGVGVAIKKNSLLIGVGQTPSRTERRMRLKSTYRDASQETIEFLLDHPELTSRPILADRQLQKTIGTISR